MSLGALFIATFIACLVEAVEAVTIVLAAGTSRDWRSTMKGVIVAAIVLAATIAILGPAITLIPVEILRVIVGALLLVFGLQWVRKAILRASGYKALHDEAAIYAREVQQARTESKRTTRLLGDPYAFTLAFKGVLLEGLEVVFIVLTFGANARAVGWASLAAGAAVIVVIVLAVIVRGPLSRVPENTLKFVVGVMLTSFGLFWGAEGLGAEWPGADAALLVIAPAIALVSLLVVALLRARRTRARRAKAPSPAMPDPVVGSDTAETDVATPTGPGAVATATQVQAAAPVRMRRLRAFGLFWWDFIVGDDWVVTVIVLAGLGATAAIALVKPELAWIVMSAVVIAAIGVGVRSART